MAIFTNVTVLNYGGNKNNNSIMAGIISDVIEKEEITLM